MEVGKFSLIDLDGQKWLTGRKQAKAVQRERLSERTPEMVMRQSDLRYNKGSRRELVEAPTPPLNAVTKVTECMYYSGAEILNISASDVISAAKLNLAA